MRTPIRPLIASSQQHKGAGPGSALAAGSQPERTSWTGRLLVGVAWLIAAGAVGWAYSTTLWNLSLKWRLEPDYNHGFIVPVFALCLLWFRRKDFPVGRGSGQVWGLVLLAIAAGMRVASELFFYPLADAPSLVPCLAGLALLAGGWPALRWAGPSIAYLAFMFPLPGFLATQFSHPLQRIATISSTWLLQLMGLPAVSRGNVIWLTSGQIGVIEACSGLRMLMVFLAITVGAALLIDRPLWEKLFVSLSALAIAVLSNIIRIAITAFLYEYVGKDWAEAVFHDLAGYVMMPLATLLLFIELYLLSAILPAHHFSRPVVLSR